MARYMIDNLSAPIDFELSTPIRRTIQNAKNLLMLRKGELPYDRLRGFDHTLFDLPMPQLRTALIPELDRVMLWEPDAEVVEACVELNEKGEAVIRVIIEVNITGNE